MKKIWIQLAILLIGLPWLNAQTNNDKVPGEVIVKLPSGQTLESVMPLLQDKGMGTVTVKKRLSAQLNIWLLSYDNNKWTDNEFLYFLRHQPYIEIAQFNHYLEERGILPNDSLIGRQWQWSNNGTNGTKADADVDADDAWSITTGGLTALGDTIVVAVVDNGTNFNHPDLRDNLWINRGEIPGDGIDNDGNGYVDDYRGWNIVTDNDEVNGGTHGVEVAGMIGARGNNTIGVTGINWNIKIMAVKYSTSITESNVLESYSYVLRQRQLYNESKGTRGAFVVACNSSWGRDKGKASDAPLWCAMYDTMGIYGIVNCAATANQTWDVDQVGDLPTTCPSNYLIAVTATNSEDKRTFSAYGKNNIDVAAPGGAVFTTSSTSYKSSTGTSFASPMVAGLVGLLYSAPCSNMAAIARTDPSAAARLVRDYIFNGVDTIGALIKELKYGGRVNAFSSLTQLMGDCGSCPKALGITLGAITDTSVGVSWIQGDAISTVNLAFRVAGDSTWTDLNNVTTPYRLSGLRSCRTYELRLQSNCKDTSQWSQPVRFRTDGCCEMPTGLQVPATGKDTALLTWNRVSAARQYVVQYRKDKDSTWTTVLAPQPGTTIGSLLPCTTYECRIATTCDSGTTAFSGTATFRTRGCGTCIDQTYCPSTGGSTTNEWIASVSIDTLRFNTGNNNGYFFQSPTNLKLYYLRPYSFVVRAGYSGSTFSENVRVWIDYDQDGRFNDTTELAFDPKRTFRDSINGTISVPVTAKGGQTRMRVSMAFTGTTTPTGCLGSFTYGEVEDYCLEIIPAVLCEAGKNLKAGNVTRSSATITWDSSYTVLGYEVRYRKKNTVAWLLDTVTSTTLLLDGIDSCSTYECQLRTLCSNGNASDYGPLLSFQTGCNTRVEAVGVQGLALNVAPNPFDNLLTINIEAPVREDVALQLVHATGQLVGTKVIGSVMGSFRYTWSGLEGLVPGVYMLQLRTGKGTTIVEKLIKL